MIAPVKDQWYQQQTDAISEALQELICDGEIDKARQCLIDAIATWTDYHEEELTKWKRLKDLLGLSTDK